LQDIAVAELQGQQERLDVYAAQARLAMAQIQDRSQLAPKGNAGAAAPSGTLPLATPVVATGEPAPATAPATAGARP
jgi:hypothetical protein